MKEISARVDELIKQKGWTAYELAKQTGISTNTVYDWYRKGSVPSLANVLKICSTLDITAEQFFCGKNGYGLSKDESHLLNEWFTLSELEKEAVLNMIETFKILKRDKAHESRNSRNSD